MAATGQRSEPGMDGRGTRRIPSRCCSVFDQQMRRSAPSGLSFTSSRVRCFSGSKTWTDGAVRLDLRRKEKKATRKRHQMAAWKGMEVSSKSRIRRSRSSVMGDFWLVFVPKRRFSPLVVKVTGKLCKASQGKSWYK